MRNLVLEVQDRITQKIEAISENQTKQVETITCRLVVLEECDCNLQEQCV